MKNLLTISVVFFISVNISADNNDGLKKADIITELIPQQSTTGEFRPDNVSIGITERSTKNQIIISGVPSYLWRHGCGPTALGMVIGYYDGIGFSALIDGNASTQTNNVNNAIANSEHYNDYSEPIDCHPDLFADMSETGGAHTSNCIADFMETSWSSEENRYGWSWSSLIRVAFTEYVQICNDDYSTNTSYERFSGASWDKYKNEINNKRPVVLLVDSDGNGYTDHFVTGIGYDESNSTYAIYDTWDNSIHWYQWRKLSNNNGWGIYCFYILKINGIVNLPDSFSFAEDGQLIENFANYSDDIDLDVFTLTVSGNTEINAEIDGLNVTFTATATENWNGAETLTFSVINNQGIAVASDDVDVIISYLNDTPFVKIPIADFAFDEDTYDNSINLNNVFDDVDLIYGDGLSFGYSGNMNIIVEISIDGIVTFAPNANWNGNETITFTATDNYSEQISDEVVVTINAIVYQVTKLVGNSPNPFNPTTTIIYHLKESCFVNLDIFNSKGQKVNSLVNQSQNAGKKSIIWEGMDSQKNKVGSGLFFYKLCINGKFHSMKKCIMVK